MNAWKTYIRTLLQEERGGGEAIESGANTLMAVSFVGVIGGIAGVVGYNLLKAKQTVSDGFDNLHQIADDVSAGNVSAGGGNNGNIS